MSVRQVALDEKSARIDRGPVAFAQAVKDGDLVALVQQQLAADTANVARAADDKNFHSGENRRAPPLINPKCCERNA